MTNRAIPTPLDVKARIAAAGEADKHFHLRKRHARAANRAARLLAELVNMHAETPTYLRNVMALHFAEASVVAERLRAELDNVPSCVGGSGSGGAAGFDPSLDRAAAVEGKP